MKKIIYFGIIVLIALSIAVKVMAPAADLPILVECPTGQSQCDETCVDLNTDKYNCGNCEVVCSDIQSCVNGRCLTYEGFSCTSGTGCISGYCDNDGVGVSDSRKCFTPAVVSGHCDPTDATRCQQSDGSCEYSTGSGVALADELMPGAVVDNKESTTKLYGCPAGSTCVIGSWTTCWAYDGDYGGPTNNFCTSLGGTWTTSRTGDRSVDNSKLSGEYGCTSVRPNAVACDDGTNDGFCCGDDKNEFYKYNPTYNKDACCSSNSLIVNSTGHCTTNICGDGVVSDSEECDNGTLNVNSFTCNNYGGYCDYCNTTCKANVARGPYCGDGIINGNAVEQCDSALLPTSARCTDGIALGGDFDGGTVGCDSCKLNYNTCTCDSGTNNCYYAPSKPLYCVDLNDDINHCGVCGNFCDDGSNAKCCSGRCVSLNDVNTCGNCNTACQSVSCGNYNDLSPACLSAENGCKTATSCPTSCTSDADCKSSVGAYCNESRKCDNTCQFNATVFDISNDCIHASPVGGCRPGDNITATIRYRGNCVGTTSIQVDLATASPPYPNGYNGRTFCNIQQNQALSSMTAFSSTTPLVSTSSARSLTFKYQIPPNFGVGESVCVGKNFTYFNIGLKGEEKYYAVPGIDIHLVNPICGDDECMPIIGENTQTCFRDCFNDGWETKNNQGWSLKSGNILHANRGGISVVSTYTVDIKAGVSYTLSYNIFKNSDCDVKFDFNGGNCTSAEDFKNKLCFKKFANMVAVNSETGYGNNLISINSNGDATNLKYFRDVKLRISTSGTCTSVDIANISLVESTFYNPDQVKYDYSKLPSNGNISSTGCCPNSYCWDGKVCQDSWQWMNNATLPGVWNSLNISNWTDKHINISNLSNTISYRCVINNSNGEANWIPSRTKYDWNFKASGYCARETDCFVSESFPVTTAGYSKGCIHHGDIVSDGPSYDFGQGNHYCYQGNWTTKSYILATFLQNISEGMSYSLQCYNDTSMNYNLNDRTSVQVSNILSSCVLKQSGESVLKENIITGVVFRTTANDAVKDFLTILTNEYKQIYGVDITTDLKLTCLTGGEKVTDSNFTKCIEKSATGDIGGLYVYYESNYTYVVFSDSPITGLTQQTLWGKIKGFFSGLFTPSILTTPFTSLNYTTNYDKIYVFRNSTVNVTALEEAKYDEAEQNIATIMYVKYTGTYNETNPLYQGVIYKSTNDTMIAQGNTKINVVVRVSNNTSPPEQEIIIKSQEPSGLWRYFTSILRTR